MYETVEIEGQTLIKKTNEDGSVSWIPSDPANSDYQAYLAANSTPSVSSDPVSTL